MKKKSKVALEVARRHAEALRSAKIQKGRPRRHAQAGKGCGPNVAQPDPQEVPEPA